MLASRRALPPANAAARATLGQALRHKSQSPKSTGVSPLTDKFVHVPRPQRFPQASRSVRARIWKQGCAHAKFLSDVAGANDRGSCGGKTDTGLSWPGTELQSLIGSARNRGPGVWRRRQRRDPRGVPGGGAHHSPAPRSATLRFERARAKWP
eukprot:scaffold17506_cov132-Isochrysis_galbana.AAC.1